MNNIDDIIRNRIEYFKNKEYEKIYDIYSKESHMQQFFPDKEVYGEHFLKLTELFLPVSVEIYKVLYNNDTGEVLYTENVRNLEEDVLETYYAKAYFVKENDTWKIIKEERETSFKK